MTDFYTLIPPVQLGDFSVESLSDKHLRQSFIDENIPVPNQEINLKIGLDDETVNRIGVDFFDIGGIPAFSKNALDQFPKEVLDEFSFHPVYLTFKGGTRISYAAKVKNYHHIIDEDKTDIQQIGRTSILTKPIFKSEELDFYVVRDKKYPRILVFTDKMIDVIKSRSLKIEYVKL